MGNRSRVDPEASAWSHYRLVQSKGKAKVHAAQQHHISRTGCCKVPQCCKMIFRRGYMLSVSYSFCPYFCMYILITIHNFIGWKCFATSQEKSRKRRKQAFLMKIRSRETKWNPKITEKNGRHLFYDFNVGMNFSLYETGGGRSSQPFCTKRDKMRWNSAVTHFELARLPLWHTVTYFATLADFALKIRHPSDHTTLPLSLTLKIPTAPQEHI